MLKMSGKKEVRVLFHDVEYWYNDFPEKELTEEGEEYITEQINKGYSSGELNYFDVKDGKQYYGWWQIKGYETQS